MFVTCFSVLSGHFMVVPICMQMTTVMSVKLEILWLWHCTRHIQTGLECAVTMHSIHTCNMTCCKAWTHLCDCVHACIEFYIFATTKTSDEVVCAAYWKCMEIKVFHRVMKFHIMCKFLKAEAEMGPGEKKDVTLAEYANGMSRPSWMILQIPFLRTPIANTIRNAGFKTYN